MSESKTKSLSGGLPLFWWLPLVEVNFFLPDGSLGTRKFNVARATRANLFCQGEVEMASQQAVAKLLNSAGDQAEGIRIADVLLISSNPCGRGTEAEWKARYEELRAQAAEPKAPKADPIYDR